MLKLRGSFYDKLISQKLPKIVFDQRESNEILYMFVIIKKGEIVESKILY